MNRGNVQETLISAQHWKLYFGGIGLGILGIGLFATNYLANVFDIETDVFRTCTAFFGLLIFTGSIFSIRCPSCGLGLVGYSMPK